MPLSKTVRQKFGDYISGRSRRPHYTPVSMVTNGFAALYRLIARVIGFAFLIFGLIGMLSPIPFGLVFFIIGLMFLIPTTPFVTKMVRKARGSIGLFDKAMCHATRRAPYPMKRVLRETESFDRY